MIEGHYKPTIDPHFMNILWSILPVVLFIDYLLGIFNTPVKLQVYFQGQKKYTSACDNSEE